MFHFFSFSRWKLSHRNYRKCCVRWVAWFLNPATSDEQNQNILNFSRQIAQDAINPKKWSGLTIPTTPLRLSMLVMVKWLHPWSKCWMTSCSLMPKSLQNRHHKKSFNVIVFSYRQAQSFFFANSGNIPIQRPSSLLKMSLVKVSGLSLDSFFNLQNSLKFPLFRYFLDLIYLGQANVPKENVSEFKVALFDLKFDKLADDQDDSDDEEQDSEKNPPIAPAKVMKMEPETR